MEETPVIPNVPQPSVEAPPEAAPVAAPQPNMAEISRQLAELTRQVAAVSGAVTAPKPTPADNFMPGGMIDGPPKPVEAPEQSIPRQNQPVAIPPPTLPQDEGMTSHNRVVAAARARANERRERLGLPSLESVEPFTFTGEKPDTTQGPNIAAIPMPPAVAPLPTMAPPVASAPAKTETPTLPTTAPPTETPSPPPPAESAGGSFIEITALLQTILDAVQGNQKQSVPEPTISNENKTLEEIRKMVEEIRDKDTTAVFS